MTTSEGGWWVSRWTIQTPYYHLANICRTTHEDERCEGCGSFLLRTDSDPQHSEDRGSYDRKVANAAEKLSKIKNLTHTGAYVVAAPSAEEDNARTHKSADLFT